MKRNDLPGSVIGYRKDGRPIRVMAGGAPEDEPPTVVATPPEDILSSPAVKAAIAAAMEQARKEEKDKLYPRITKSDEHFKAMEEELAKLRKDNEARLALEQQKADELAAKAEAKRREEVSAKTLLEENAAKLEKQRLEDNAKWELKFAQLEQERETERALLAKEREFLELKQYTQARIAESVDDIAPELIDYVGGNTREEVDQSIERAKAKTQAILDSVQQTQGNARLFEKGVSTAGYSTTGPLDTAPITQQFSAEDLKNMPMDKYREFREKVGLGGDSRGSNRGLFG